MDKKQFTIRLPQATFDYLTSKAHDENKSVNDVMVDITEEYIKWQNAENTIKEIIVLREKLKDEYGVHPDSTEDIRKFREGDR
jgi:hypothetical protein